MRVPHPNSSPWCRIDGACVELPFDEILWGSTNFLMCQNANLCSGSLDPSIISNWQLRLFTWIHFEDPVVYNLTKKLDFSTSANFVQQQIYKLHLRSPILLWEAEVFLVLVFFKNVSLQKSCVTICNDFCIPSCSCYTWWLFSLQLDIFMNNFFFWKKKKKKWARNNTEKKNVSCVIKTKDFCNFRLKNDVHS